MAIVLIPPLVRDLTNGNERIAVTGKTVGQVIANLEAAFPGIRYRLCSGEELGAQVALVIDNEMSDLGLLQPVEDDSEIQFVPMVHGG